MQSGNPFQQAVNMSQGLAGKAEVPMFPIGQPAATPPVSIAANVAGSFFSTPMFLVVIGVFILVLALAFTVYKTF
jgi:hypothetical protein